MGNPGNVCSPFHALTSTVVLEIPSRQQQQAVKKETFFAAASWKFPRYLTLSLQRGPTNTVMTSFGSEIRARLLLLLDVRLWANYLTSLNLNFLSL